MSDELDLAPIEARTTQFAKRYPWRLLPGAKDYLARDRAALLAEVKRLRATTPEWEYAHEYTEMDPDPTPDNEGNK